MIVLNTHEEDYSGDVRLERQYKKIVIGIDQSYNNTGLSVASQKGLELISSINLNKILSNSEKRFEVSSGVSEVIEHYKPLTKELIIIIEKIRTFSQGFISTNYIKSIGALNACIVDTAFKYGIPVYSVDTRSWKSQIVGTSKPQENKYGISPEKWPTIKYVKNLGFGKELLVPASKSKKKGVVHVDGKPYTINDDAADSACIALYGFLPKERQKLEKEH